MQVSTTPRHVDLQHARIPKLSYRKSAAPGESLPQTTFTMPVQNTPRESDSSPNRTIAGATPIVGPAPELSFQDTDRPASMRPSTFSQPPKKKASLFGGLFVKEPTLVALAQVEAELKAKHGSTNTEVVPHVSSSRMPVHVPKVNSKWDGMPETIKMQEKQDKGADGFFKRNSLLPPSTARSRGSDLAEQFRAREFRGRSNDDDRANPWGFEDNEFRSESRYSDSSSSDCYGPPRQRPPSGWSQSLRSPSGNSLPEITAFFPNTAPRLPPGTQRGQSSGSSHTRSTDSSSRTRVEPDSYLEHRAPPIDAIPEHSSSLVATPREASPVTPGHLSDPEREPSTGQAIDTILETSGRVVSNAHRNSKNYGRTKSGAFLAGEAQPMKLPERRSSLKHQSDLGHRQSSNQAIGRVQQDIGKRPHSSRDRLGLGASMVVRTDAAPWESQPGPDSVILSPSDKGPASPKKRYSKGLAVRGK